MTQSGLNQHEGKRVRNGRHARLLGMGIRGGDNLLESDRGRRASLAAVTMSVGIRVISRAVTVSIVRVLTTSFKVESETVIVSPGWKPSAIQLPLARVIVSGLNSTKSTSAVELTLVLKFAMRVASDFKSALPNRSIEISSPVLVTP